MFRILKVKTTLIVLSLFLLPFAVSAFSEGELRNFNIDSSYDLYGREDIEAYLIRATDSLYFYIEKSWWDGRSSKEQNDIKIAIFDLGEEFKNKIYPVLTSNFGQEWKPGIDGEERIIVLWHPMKTDRGGYFREIDEYSRFQAPSSNEMEMVYLNAGYITSPLAKSFLSHEFSHLITFNQKERLRRITEETWLNEARAEVAPTLLGYDDKYEGSYLQKRVRIFLENNSNSLTEWQGVAADYGVLNLFTQYLIDHYGVRILTNSLQSPETGITSINSALRKNGFQEDFSQIFTNWTIAVFANDCSLGAKYCYKNPNLKNLRIVPESNFLTPATESTLSVYGQLKDWSAKWQRLFGGKGNLTLKFNGKEGVKFKVPYLLCDYAEKCLVKFFNLDNRQKEEIIIQDFSSKYSYLIIIPSVQNKLSGFGNNEQTYSFSWDAGTKEPPKDDSELTRKLLERMSALKAEIARAQAEINGILTKIGTGPISPSYACSEIKNDLFFGMQNNQEVRCLQEFLKTQGTEIYPEGLTTGNFLSLTEAAVIRFQEKYASEILSPLGLSNGTGYVGQMTRAKINEMMD